MPSARSRLFSSDTTILSLVRVAIFSRFYAKGQRKSEFVPVGTPKAHTDAPTFDLHSAVSPLPSPEEYQTSSAIRQHSKLVHSPRDTGLSTFAKSGCGARPGYRDVR